MVKTIRVSEGTHDRLSNHGRIDESYDDLITRLLDTIEVDEDGFVYREEA